MTNENRIAMGGKLEWLKVSDLTVNAVAQRPLRLAHAQDIANNFDPDALDPLKVNRRGKTLHVVAGQHRHKALELMGWADQFVLCQVWEGLTDAQEAHLFLATDRTKRVRPFDRFRIGVTGKDKELLDIQRIIEQLNLKISSQYSDGSIKATSALVRNYDLVGAEGLLLVLGILRDAYGGVTQAFAGQLIDGMALVINRYGDTVDRDRIVDRLSRAPGGVNGLTGKASTIQQSLGRQKRHCVAAAIVEFYNRGDRSGRLIPWWR